jgi:hypothetical protein
MPSGAADAKFIRLLGEEIPMPVAMQVGDLKRKPPLGGLMRNYLIE